jgi:hemerythrin-like domain-containing protein
MGTIARLRREHDVMLRLADALGRESVSFGCGSGGDLVLMRDALRYLTAFPDLFHHAVDDAARWQLADRGLLARETAAALDFEHRRLRQHGEHLLRLLEGALADVLVPRTDIAGAAQRYAAHLLGSVQREEDALLPLLQEHPIPQNREEADAAAFGSGPDDAAPAEAQRQRLLASLGERIGCDCASVSADVAPDARRRTGAAESVQ